MDEAVIYVGVNFLVIEDKEDLRPQLQEKQLT